MSQARQWSVVLSASLAAAALLANVTIAKGESLSSLPPVVGVAEVFALDDLSGVALYGFDPVTYFLGEGPKPGLPDHEIIWSGVAWRFASAANRDAFLDDPEAYAPRLGGYDASAVARGLTIRANPWLFAVRSDRLYLFRSDHGRARFLADEHIAEEAEARWPELKRELVQP